MKRKVENCKWYTGNLAWNKKIPNVSCRHSMQKSDKCIGVKCGFYKHM